MPDILEKFENSLIQHGKENNRVYLMKLGNGEINRVIDYIETLSIDNFYTKIFVKIPESVRNNFLERGYIREGAIPKFYKGRENCLFLVKYPHKDGKRSIIKDEDKIKSVLSSSIDKKNNENAIFLNDEFIFSILKPEDSVQAANLYKKVFKTYPFPIFDANYISKTMQENIIYFGIKKQNKILALSSAEVDYEGLNAEMTDFATDEDYRGKNFSLFLLQKMEREMKKSGIRTVYTIARSLSHGMNITFAKNNYLFGGTLINNTNIFGNIESMNIWYKSLPDV